MAVQIGCVHMNDLLGGQVADDNRRARLRVCTLNRTMLPDPGECISVSFCTGGSSGPLATPSSPMKWKLKAPSSPTVILRAWPRV